MASFTTTVRTRCGVVNIGRRTNAIILSGFVPGSVVNFDRWPSGHLYAANGLDQPYRWNGIRSSFVPMGIETPSGTPTIATSGSGSISGSYKIYVRFIDEDGQFGPLSTVSAEAVVTSITTFTFGSLPTPTNPRVVKRQVLRNTDGQYSTFYVDLETTDLWSASLTSTKSDTTLAAQTEVPLFDLDGNSLTDQWTAPRNDKPILVHARNRMFAAGEAPYTDGNARVTFGSATVTGTNTAWTSQMANREFIVLGVTSPKVYTISSVSVTAQTLTLSEAYRGVTDLFATYAIRPPAAQRNTIYYSNSANPDQWPSINAVQMEEAGESITALIPAPAFLYVALGNALYRFTFDQDPGRDGSFYRIATRGSVNQRTWCRANEDFYVLDRQGIYMLSGEGVEQISLPIQDLFTVEAKGDYKIDWTQALYFHASWDAEDHTIRFYVSLGGPMPPRHALCYNYLAHSWWIEEYPFSVGCSVAQTAKGHLYLGGPGQKLYEQGIGTVDGPDPSGYRMSGTVSSSTLLSFTDSSLALPANGVVGAPVVITGGIGKGQIRTIESVSGTTVKVVEPWTTKPDTTSTYQVGGIAWRLRTGWHPYVLGAKVPIEAFWLPVTHGTFDVRFFEDHSTAARKFALDYPLVSADADGVSTKKNSADVTFKLSTATGYGRVYTEEPFGPYSASPNIVSLEVAGVSTEDGLFLYQVSLGGVGG